MDCLLVQMKVSKKGRPMESTKELMMDALKDEAMVTMKAMKREEAMASVMEKLKALGKVTLLEALMDCLTVQMKVSKKG